MLYPNAYEGVKGIRIPAILAILLCPFPFLLTALMLLLEKQDATMELFIALQKVALMLCLISVVGLQIPLGKAGKDEPAFQRAQSAAVTAVWLYVAGFCLLYCLPVIGLLLEFAAAFFGVLCLRRTVEGIMLLAVRLDCETLDDPVEPLSRLSAAMLWCICCGAGSFLLYTIQIMQTLIAVLLASVVIVVCSIAVLIVLFPFLNASRKMLLYAFAPPDQDQFTGVSILNLSRRERASGQTGDKRNPAVFNLRAERAAEPAPAPETRGEEKQQIRLS